MHINKYSKSAIKLIEQKRKQICSNHAKKIFHYSPIHQCPLIKYCKHIQITLKDIIFYRNS